MRNSKKNPGKADLEKLEKGIKAGKLPADAKFALQTPVTVGELENQLYPITKGLKPIRWWPQPICST